MLADFQCLDGARVDKSISLIAANGEGVGDVLHAEDEGHSVEICVRHSSSGLVSKFVPIYLQQR